MQQAINRALDIIEFLSTEAETPRSFTEIASHMKLNTATCANIIKALVNRGFVEKLDHRKGYLLGKKMYQLTNFDGYKKELIKNTAPILEKLTDDLNENTLLSVLKGNSRLVLLQFHSKQEIQAISSIEKEAYDSSTGRLLVAFLPDQELKTYLANHGLPKASVWKEASTQKGFYKEIEKIRLDGYAFQESDRQISGLAVGIYQQNKVVAAISVFSPSFRFEHTDRVLLISKLKAAATAISTSLKV